MNTASLSRRDLLRAGALAAPVLLVPKRLRAASPIAANERLRIAVVGVGGRGRAALHAFWDEEIVALCDVDYDRARQRSWDEDQMRTDVDPIARFPQAAWFHDYRAMFEKMADRIDAVAIDVPDHMHFPIAMSAIALKKHVFVEKPLCHAIAEVRALHAAARAAGVVTQMGNQGRATEAIRLAREWVQAGLIGPVHTVHAWTGHRDLAKYSHPEYDDDSAPAETPPASLHYDAWLGVAPARPYRRMRSHNVWRGFSEYGGGAMGDWACHQMDAAFYALDLDAPTSVEAASTAAKRLTFPEYNTVKFRFPARGSRGPVELTWFDGGLLPPAPVAGMRFDPNGGSFLYGDRGILWVGSQSATVRLLPESRMRELRSSLPPKSIPRVVGGPHREWVRAIREGGVCGSNFDYAAPLTEAVLLGIAAIHARQRLDWDAAGGRIVNVPSANALLGPGYAYRPGWGV